MKYVVIETAERTSYVIGKASDMHEAREMMKERFQKIFWEKFPNEAASEQSLEEVYRANLDESEFEFDEETAFINGVHGYDYDWKILDTSCEDVLEKPLSIMEMLDRCDADLYVEGLYVEADVMIDLSELIDNNLAITINTAPKAKTNNGKMQAAMVKKASPSVEAPMPTITASASVATGVRKAPKTDNHFLNDVSGPNIPTINDTGAKASTIIKITSFMITGISMFILSPSY